ncbi:flagellin [Oceaniovalibus guishaninsula JLT2003]|uniref:Flagellin n=2 Tax=Oceaniovalibus TaxID=1207070 RepID=K2I4H5_9RHOB|nr:flagellin [Oceaniovalibus guishaninsula JLT2003]
MGDIALVQNGPARKAPQGQNGRSQVLEGTLMNGAQSAAYPGTNMSSILTNNSAMVALQTLRNTNANLAQTQEQISTGKKVGSAKDNAAVWAVSKQMEVDVSAFKVINDSLGTAEATVSTGMAGAKRVTDLLNQMKDLAAGAMTDGTDFGEVQDLIAKKATEITSAINGSQLNGINLLKTDIGNGSATSTGTFTALASLDRANGGATTTANTITVDSVDFEAGIDVAGLTPITDQTTAATALGQIEALLDIAIEGTADLGAAAANISSQREFVSSLTDSLKTGIGSLVDTNMEEASARMQALQTQQQLGVQSLSIATQSQQSILSLFR